MSSTNRGAARKAFDDYPTPISAIDLFLDAAAQSGILPREHRAPTLFEDTRPPPLPQGRWLEPCAGEGRIIERVRARKWPVFWQAWEIQGKYEQQLARLETYPVIGDCLDLAGKYPVDVDYLGYPFAVAISNPPYNEAMPILLALRRIAHTVVLLLRRNFIGSAKRAQYLRSNMPDEYLLPIRPSFVWRHAYWLRCGTCGYRTKVSEDAPAGQKASKSSAYVRDIAEIESECEHKSCSGTVLLADETIHFERLRDKTKTTTSDSCEYCWCVWTPDSGRVGSTRMLAFTPKEKR